ncbi:MBL fold metallo-hydrolase [Archangium minus]|uniref:MBL fold metallo-hydrolase n=1 Tax=Archangium minus TaxID=83450 RepID=A0ABY9X974_9BACT|nr:MBL fold metallo-hydrolase [Archangium minus]
MDRDSSNTQSREPAAEEWGRLYVTRKCIGAATCRNFAPELLGEVAPTHAERDDGDKQPSGPSVLPGSHDPGAFTGVLRQPRNKEEYLAARTAAAACPFSAIRLERPSARIPPGELGSPWRDWPRRLEDNVWVLGHPSAENAGALAYFIELPGGGLLVDVPKPSEELFLWLEQQGGVRWLFLTHRDHVQHHADFAKRFPGCRRVMGAADVNPKGGGYAAATGDVEFKLGSGPGPMTLEGTPIAEDALAEAELAVLPQPGHTPGSLCLVYRGRFLFTGDHLGYSRRLGHIAGYRLQCWEDWERQCASVRRLKEWADAGRLRFAWLLPGHGDWHCFEDASGPASASAALARGLEWMERQPPGRLPASRFVLLLMSRMNPRSGFARFVRAIGGEGNDAWLLPRATRRYVNDYDPARTRTAIRRVQALAVASLALVVSLIWIGAHVVSSLLARQ